MSGYSSHLVGDWTRRDCKCPNVSLLMSKLTVHRLYMKTNGINVIEKVKVH